MPVRRGGGVIIKGIHCFLIHVKLQTPVMSQYILETDFFHFFLHDCIDLLIFLFPGGLEKVRYYQGPISQALVS